MHGCLAAGVVKARRSVGDRVTRQHHILFHSNLATFTARHNFVAKRNLALFDCNRVGLLVDHADFQGGGTAQNVLGLGGVLYAWQLHDNTGSPLLLDHRFGYAQFVDTVSQGGDVLLQGKFLHARFGFRLESCRERKAIGLVFRGEGEIAEYRTQLVDTGVTLIAGGEMHGDGIAFTADAAVADLVAAQFGAKIVLVADGGFFQRCFHVDFEQEVHAAAQIQAEVHRQRVDGGEPGWRG